MGIFNKLFRSSESKESKQLPWIPLNDLRQIHHIKEKSKSKTQIIFKHSTRCGISRMVMNQFIERYEFTEKEADLYYLDLLSYRDVSREVGIEFMVMHESPQILVIKNGNVVAHASHGAVNSIALERYI